MSFFKSFSQTSKSIVTVNGKVYTGDNVTIVDGKVMVNGKDVTPNGKTINISVQGNIAQLKCDVCTKIEVTGDAGRLETMSGDVTVSGSVSGGIKTMSGDITCGNVSGSVETMSGDINKR